MRGSWDTRKQSGLLFALYLVIAALAVTFPGFCYFYWAKDFGLVEAVVVGFFAGIFVFMSVNFLGSLVLASVRGIRKRVK